ncbi:hypothetical protein [Clostridium tarantellae]|uniref:Uncharacterized protein n=1 Tax=Clostridium tarantellae TaxID=39493 RepID=A0A6I1MLW9_9CLOT|nr:hypothetical protein [Clostridium tarantellae]MPQ43428.1 hypothetical protein [Clostridium tarantellae]
MKKIYNENQLLGLSKYPREVDSINLTINDRLVDYISKEEGVSIKDAPYSFMLRDIGVGALNLNISI